MVAEVRRSPAATAEPAVHVRSDRRLRAATKCVDGPIRKGIRAVGTGGSRPLAPTKRTSPHGAEIPSHRFERAVTWSTRLAVIIGLLMSAARSSWDLLVKVGEERRAAPSTG
jgi:hypothetical protein